MWWGCVCTGSPVCVRSCVRVCVRVCVRDVFAIYDFFTRLIMIIIKNIIR